MKKIRKILLSTMMLSALLISGCDTSLTPSNSSGKLEPQYQIFLKAKESGFEGTYEEWLESIKGADGTNGVDGVNGKSIILELKDGYVCWKYEGETSSTQLIAVSELVGEAGPNGVDGATWVTGNTAPSVEDGKDGDLHLNLVTFEVSLKISGAWTSVGTIKGETGQNGTNGKDGVDGEKGDKGEAGKDGAAGNGIVKIEKTSTDGLIDTYTITFTDETKTTFYVTNGRDGINGEKGEDGTNGVDGATWVTGNTAPSAEEGKDGDFYLNLVTFEVSVKVDGTWTSIGTIKGDPGQKGEAGADGEKGEDGQKGDPGQKGEDGTNGKDGATWITGNTPPNVGEGKDGDLYLNLITFEVSIKADGVWNYVGTIKGEDGKDAEVKEYNVTFDVNGGVMPENYTDITQTVKEGSTLTLPIPTREGYVFNGWFTGMTANDGQFYNFTPVFNDLTLIAKWSVETITVSIFDEWSGTTMTVEVPQDMLIGEYTFSDSKNRLVYEAYLVSTGESVDLNSTFVDGNQYRLISIDLESAIYQSIEELQRQHEKVLNQFNLYEQFRNYLYASAHSLSFSNYIDLKNQMTVLAETFIAENTSVEAYVTTLINELEMSSYSCRIYATVNENLAIDKAIEDAKNQLNSLATIDEINAYYDSNYRNMDFSILINPTEDMLGFGNAKILVIQQYINMYGSIGSDEIYQHMNLVTNELFRAPDMESLLKMIEDDTLYLAETYGSVIDEKGLFYSLNYLVDDMMQNSEELTFLNLDIAFKKLKTYYDNSIMMIREQIDANSMTESISLLDYLMLWDSLVRANSDLSNEFYLYNYMASYDKSDILSYSTEEGQSVMLDVLTTYLTENNSVAVMIGDGEIHLLDGYYSAVMNDYEAACILDINSKAVVSDLNSINVKWNTVLQYSQVTPEDQTTYDTLLEAVMNTTNFGDYKLALEEFNSFVDTAYQDCMMSNPALSLLSEWNDFKERNSKFDYSEYDIVFETLVNHLSKINDTNPYLVDYYTNSIRNNIIYSHFNDSFNKMSCEFIHAFMNALSDYNMDVYMQYETQMWDYSNRIQNLGGMYDKGIDILLEMIEFIINEVEPNLTNGK